jgi:hypothetical protein
MSSILCGFRKCKFLCDFGCKIFRENVVCIYIIVYLFLHFKRCGLWLKFVIKPSKFVVHILKFIVSVSIVVKQTVVSVEVGAVMEIDRAIIHASTVFVWLVGLIIFETAQPFILIIK